MKYAFMTFSCPDKTWDQVLSTAQELGYQGVEPRAQSGQGHGVELESDAATRRQIRTQAQAAGVEVACIATSCRYADPAGARENVELTRRFIDLAADLNCRRLRVFGGDYPQAVDRQQAMDSLITSLQGLADAAAAKNVTLCLETHDSWCNADHVAQVMQRVNHPAIAVNWDVMHPVRAGGSPSMEQAYQILRPWIRHVHFHDGLKRLDKLVMVPLGQGELDHRAVLSLLKRDRYSGFLSGEWIAGTMAPEFFQVHLKQELLAMKALEQGLA